MPERKNPHHMGTKPPAYTPNSPTTAKRRTEKHRGRASGNGIYRNAAGVPTDIRNRFSGRNCRTATPESHPNKCPGMNFQKATPQYPPPLQRSHLRQLLTSTHPEQFAATNSHNNVPPHNKSTPTHNDSRGTTPRNEKQRAAPKCSPLFFCGSRSDYFALFLS